MLESGETDKYSSHNLCYLQDFGKLYDKLIAYLIFEIDFNTLWNYLKIDLEDFNQTVAILKSVLLVASHIVLTCVTKCASLTQLRST